MGGKAHIAYTPVISDGESQGSKAMRYSLISRDYIAWCAFSTGLTREDAIEFHPLLCLKRCHACDQWFSSRVSTSYRLAL
jgi:dihydroxyacid dehydratase/phosphogluconate dehydratase